jgi:hypothetical protein
VSHSGDARALALATCTLCGGAGQLILWEGRRGVERTRWCKCTYRRAFRACLKQYHRCAQYPDPGPRWELSTRGYFASLPRAEYVADFELCGKRLLAGRPTLRPVFELHYLMGLAFDKCCARLKCDRGQFFHRVYETEAILGKAFLELEPYALFPRDYFSRRTTEPPVRARRSMRRTQRILGRTGVAPSFTFAPNRPGVGLAAAA